MSDLFDLDPFDDTKHVTTVKLTKEVKRLWRNQAKKHGVTMNDYLETILYHVVAHDLFVENGKLINPAEEEYSNRKIALKVLESQKQVDKRLNQVVGFIQQHEKRNLAPLMFRMNEILKKLEGK